MSEENHFPSRRTMIVSVLVLLGLLLAGLSPLLPRASAITFPGNTDALVNLGQITRDSSSAIPIFGFSMNASASGPAESLRSVTIGFNPRFGWVPGNDRTLRALSPDGRFSGVAIYRDVGTVDDALDAGDVAITMRSGPTWNGNNVTFDFTAGGGTLEPIPTSVVGRWHWLVVIRTSNSALDLIQNGLISATIRANAIVASSGFSTVSQPAIPVNANDLRLDLTSGFDMVGVSGFIWIGPATAQVNSKAVMGIHVVDGGIPTNRGIQDTITSLVFQVEQTGGAISSGDFKPISTNPATSGIALYRDDGTVDDQWDPTDTGVVPASITPTTFPAGSVTMTMTFTPPGLSVPHVGIGALDFFIVVRTAGIVSGDRFRIDIPAGGIHVRGIMGAQVDADLRPPLAFQTTSSVQADSTPPQTTGEGWISGSNYLYASGLNLYFSHAMTSTQTAWAAGLAREDESGLANATYKLAPSLASSPGVQLLSGAGSWQFYFGGYGVNNVSLGTSSPVDATICDRVGNCLSTSRSGRVYNFIYTTSKVIVLPEPGWNVAGPTPPFWIDPTTGKLWFSNLVAGSVSATLNVHAASLSGAELTSISAPSKPGLGGPTPTSTSFPAGTFNSPWATTYTINASANSLGAPITITAFDNLGNSGSANFDYGLDTRGPTISILNPVQGTIVGGNIVAKANIVDDHTKVLYVQFLVDSRPYPGLINGTTYFTPVSTADFPDGFHRISVQAWDMVGNQNTMGIDVTFSNAVTPPKLSLLTPVAGSYIQGLYAISASATDNTGVKAVNFTLRRVSDNSPAFSAALGFGLGNGLWEANLDTTALEERSYWLIVTAMNSGGLTTSVTVQIQVVNRAPTLAVNYPLQNVYVSGTWAIDATASSAFLGGITYSVDGGPWVPAAIALNTTKLSDGRHTIAVRAFDLSGKTTTQNIDVTVDNTPPTGSISSLAAGQVLKGPFTFRVFAWDAVGVKAVTLAVAGRTVNMVYNPQSGYWEYILDTAGIADGSYTAQPTIEDLSGKKTTPAAASFQVKNQPELMQSIVSALPLAAFSFLIFAFVLILLLLKAGSVARWMHRGEAWKAHREELGEIEIRPEGQPPRPPSPPSPPPPGGP